MIKSIFSVLAASLMLGCGSGISVTHDFDREADFASLRSFAWLPMPATAVGSTKAAIERNSLLDKRIKNAVNSQLVAQGYEMDELNPDFVLMYHTGIDDKIDVTDWGYGYSSPYWGGRNVSVYQYTQGTLILDVIDPADKQLIWRSEAQATVNQSDSPERREDRLRAAAAKMLSNFPPNE